MSPQQEIYDEVFKVCLNLGYDTYNYLPAEEVAYPFVYVGEQFDQDIATKTVIYGDVQQTIHIYGTTFDRGSLSRMVNNIRRDLRKLKKSKHFDLTIKNMSAQTIPENIGNQPLLHIVLEVDFTFN